MRRDGTGIFSNGKAGNSESSECSDYSEYSESSDCSESSDYNEYSEFLIAPSLPITLNTPSILIAPMAPLIEKVALP